MVLQEPTILSSPTKMGLVKDPAKPAPGPTPAPHLASMSSEMSFEDPWMKRGMEEGRPRELVCEVKPEKRQVEPAKGHQGGQGQGWGPGEKTASGSGESL